MKLKTFIFVIALAIVAMSVGILLTKQQQGEQSVQQQKLIQNFALNKLDTITIEKAGGKLVIEKRLEQWLLPQAQNYLVNQDKLSQFIQQLSNTKIVESKTKNPKNYERLGLQDITDNNSTGTLVTLNTGKTAITFVLGNKSSSSTGQYVRLINEPQSYLIDQRFDLSNSYQTWLDETILSVSLNQVEKLVWQQSQNNRFEIAKSDNNDDFSLVGAELSQTLQYDSILTGLVRNTLGLSLQDVALKTAVLPKTLNKELQIELVTKDKTSVLLMFYKNKLGEHWLSAGDSKWFYKISEFNFKQLAKPLTEYLTK